MDQDYRFKFEEMRDNDPTSPSGDKPQGALGERYPGYGHGRNLGFVWPDGRRLFLSYSYLVCCERNADGSAVIITFTTHMVTLKGIRLDGMFEELMTQVTRLIICRNSRYNALAENTESVVNDIQVEKVV